MSQNIEQTSTYSRIAVLAIIATSFFLLACIFGELTGGGWGSNSSCFPYLGCTTGFFGYDAVEHLIFGIAATWILIWFFKKFPQYSLLHNHTWKNVLILIALVALVSGVWEFLECLNDVFRLEVLHQPLINFRLHINLLAQPSNIDTMGDLAFSLIGTIIGLLIENKIIANK